MSDATGPTRRRQGLPRPGQESIQGPRDSGPITPAASVEATTSAAPRRGLPRPGSAPTVTPTVPAAPVSGTPVVTARPLATATPPPPVEPAPPGRLSKVLAWSGTVLLTGFALLVLAAAAVIGLRALEELPFLRDFMRTFSGASELPAGSPVGLPVWLNWSHFLNAFFMLLIIRSGLRVRSEQRPDVYWTPKWSKDGSGKISLTVWFHQSVDALWLINGIVFYVLLFATGQWVRIVPTTWDVFPNALSALIHYVSLDWPQDDGWLNYNALQLLTYFLTTFVAAPLAALTGFRMSSLWPKKAKALSAAYPIAWARALHYPVMLYFVVFVIIHVGLVFATGAVQNLNHMYAARDDTSWVGPVTFLVSVAAMIGAVLAARPFVLRALGAVSGRLSSR